MKANLNASRPVACALAAAGIAGLLVIRTAPAQDPGASLKEAARTFARKQVEASFRAMNRPFRPFRIIGNIYYVGASDIASFLIATPEGHILINSGFETTVPLIRDSVRKLGFPFEDIKILLNSHAHIDHAGGHATLRKQTGARIVMSEQDAALLARGGRGDFLPASDEVVGYEPAQADRIIRDGDEVRLGGVTLTAHLTPGHTRGCTTWTMKVEEGGKRYDVVFHGGTTILPGVRLVDNPKYPAMVQDYEQTFGVLKSLPCDIFLAPHGSQFALGEKARRLGAGAGANPFIDPMGYRMFVARGEDAFRRQLDRERPGEVPLIERTDDQMDTIDVSAGQAPSSPPKVPGKPVVLVPYYAAVEKECDEGLRGIGLAGVQVRRASFSAIDLLRSVMLSQALRDGFDRFLFIDADIGFDPADALRLLARPEPIVAGVYMKKTGRDYSGAFAAGVDRVVFGPAAPGLYPMLYASTGFLRIRAEVLHRMIDELKLPVCHWGPIKGFYPFFLPLCVPDGRGGTRYLTEDYSFSHRLQQMGVTPMADTTIKLYHFGKYGFSFEDLSPRQRVINCTLDIDYADDEDRP